MGFILYGDPGSGSATVEMALAEIGLDVELHDVSLEGSQQRGSDYASVNPQRKLPTLITPDGTTLTESAAILITLADRYPAAKLLPESARERAVALRWLLFMATELYPVIEIKDYPERFQPEGEDTPHPRREELRRHAREIWKRRWLIVEQAAKERPWFLSSGFSLVDIYAATLSRWGQVDEWRERHLPRIEAIAAAVAARSAVRQVWARHFG